MIELYQRKPHQISKSWPVMFEGIQRLTKAKINPEGDTPKSIYEKLMIGNLVLWEGQIDNQYCGFVITKLTDRGLLIYALYGHGGTLAKDMIKHGWEKLFKYASNMRCKEIYFFTSRWKAMDKKFTDLNFQQVQAVFSCPVPRWR